MYKIIKTETGFSVVPDEKGEYETMESAIEVGKLDIPKVRQSESIKQLIEKLSDKAGAQGNMQLRDELNILLDKEDEAGITIKDIKGLSFPTGKLSFMKRIDTGWIQQLKGLIK